MGRKFSFALLPPFPFYSHFQLVHIIGISTYINITERLIKAAAERGNNNSQPPPYQWQITHFGYVFFSNASDESPVKLPDHKYETSKGRKPWHLVSTPFKINPTFFLYLVPCLPGGNYASDSDFPACPFLTCRDSFHFYFSGKAFPGYSSPFPSPHQ